MVTSVLYFDFIWLFENESLNSRFYQTCVCNYWLQSRMAISINWMVAIIRETEAYFMNIIAYQHEMVFILDNLLQRYAWVSWLFQKKSTGGRWFPLKAFPWVSYQILKIAGCACVGKAGGFFPPLTFKGNRWLAIPTCITARAWRTCRDACRDR